MTGLSWTKPAWQAGPRPDEYLICNQAKESDCNKQAPETTDEHLRKAALCVIYKDLKDLGRCLCLAGLAERWKEKEGRSSGVLTAERSQHTRVSFQQYQNAIARDKSIMVIVAFCAARYLLPQGWTRRSRCRQRCSATPMLETDWNPE